LTFIDTENFLEAPLVEDDWWESENDDDADDDDDESSSGDSINEKPGVTTCSDGDDDDDDDSNVANYIMRLQQQYTKSMISHPESLSSFENDELPINNISSNNSSIEISGSEGNHTLSLKTTNNRKRFCNRGLQTWYLARQKWLSASTSVSDHNDYETTGNSSSSTTNKKKSALGKPPIIIPESFRKELKQCLIERRQFELSQSIPLSCVIDTYEEVWRENGCD
jgi:hypothetical protein